MLLLIIQAIVASIIFLATPGSAPALSRDDLVCPVRNDWKEGSDECPCQRGWKPLPEQLEGILNAHRHWIEQKGWQDQTVLGQAILCKADLHGAKFQRVDLGGANLQGANLSRADLKSAHLNGADLKGAHLTGADLKGADLTGADLQHAMLIGTYIDDARLAFTRLAFANFAPIGVPQGYVVGIKGLSALIPVTTTLPENKVEVSPLVHLRELVQQSGYRDEERELTFAIEHAKTHNDLDFWQEHQFWRAVEGGLRLVLFEWTTDYGLRPFRAVQILLALIVIFALPALPNGGRIYRIWPSGRLETTASGATLSNESKVENLHPQNFWAAVGYALQFSLLSAFQIGWRELNVGSWIARLNRREYILKAEGWVRTLAGIQSLISVYLLAIWALTYFGRPFQ